MASVGAVGEIYAAPQELANQFGPGSTNMSPRLGLGMKPIQAQKEIIR